MKNAMIIVVIALVLSGLGLFFFLKFREIGKLTEEIENDLVIHYIQLIQRQDFPEAYELMSQAFQKAFSFEEFEKAHRQHVIDFGRLQSWEYTTSDHEFNLFSQETTIGVHYLLNFEKAQAHVIYRVIANEEPWRIDDTLGTTGPSSTVDYQTW